MEVYAPPNRKKGLSTFPQLSISLRRSKATQTTKGAAAVDISNDQRSYSKKKFTFPVKESVVDTKRGAPGFGDSEVERNYHPPDAASQKDDSDVYFKKSPHSKGQFRIPIRPTTSSTQNSISIHDHPTLSLDAIHEIKSTSPRPPTSSPALFHDKSITDKSEDSSITVVHPLHTPQSSLEARVSKGSSKDTTPNFYSPQPPREPLSLDNTGDRISNPDEVARALDERSCLNLVTQREHESARQENETYREIELEQSESDPRTQLQNELEGLRRAEMRRLEDIKLLQQRETSLLKLLQEQLRLREMEKKDAKDRETLVVDMKQEIRVLLTSNEELGHQLTSERQRAARLANELKDATERTCRMVSFLQDKFEGQLNCQLNRANQLANDLKNETERNSRMAASFRREFEDQLNCERQRAVQLANELKVEREQKSRLETEVKEHQRQLELAKQAALLVRRQQDDNTKQREVQNVVGAPVTVRRIIPATGLWGLTGSIVDDDLSKLTRAMLNQMKIVKDQFERFFPVKKIEYVMNDRLFKQFDETRTKFRNLNRNPQEMLLFHGTNQRNIDTYTRCF